MGWFVSGQALWQWRQIAQQEAIAAQVPVAEVDWLLHQLAGIDRLALRLGSVQYLDTVELTIPFDDLLQRWQQRLSDRVPVQYLAQQAPWRRFTLTVSPAVLIPRPETELIIDLVAEWVQQYPQFTTGPWADLGTGSGAIAIGLADLLPAATIHAVDCSEAALKIARHNAEQVGLGDRIQFHCGSWFDPLQGLKGQLCGMVSNPPYIPTALMAHLQPEVAQHEPYTALDGGEDGLDAIRHLVDQAPTYLQPGGLWLIEMMDDQATSVTHRLATQGNYAEVQTRQDLAGIERFAIATYSPPGKNFLQEQ